MITYSQTIKENIMNKTKTQKALYKIKSSIDFEINTADDDGVMPISTSDNLDSPYAAVSLLSKEDYLNGELDDMVEDHLHKLEDSHISAKISILEYILSADLNNPLIVAAHQNASTSPVSFIVESTSDDMNSTLYTATRDLIKKAGLKKSYDAGMCRVEYTWCGNVCYITLEPIGKYLCETSVGLAKDEVFIISTKEKVILSSLIAARIDLIE